MQDAPSPSMPGGSAVRAEATRTAESSPADTVTCTPSACSSLTDPSSYNVSADQSGKMSDTRPTIQTRSKTRGAARISNARTFQLQLHGQGAKNGFMERNCCREKVRTF